MLNLFFPKKTTVIVGLEIGTAKVAAVVGEVTDGGGVNVMDVPFRFIPCMAAGLAYYIALKIPGGIDRLGVLKQQYDEAWMSAADEDQERASLRLVPRQMFIGGT